MSFISDFEQGLLPLKIEDLRKMQAIDELGSVYYLEARDEGYGAPENWHLFKPHIPMLRQAIKGWKEEALYERVPSLHALAWELTHHSTVGGTFWEFNERKQRGYLRNGFMILMKLLCAEYDQLQREPAPTPTPTSAPVKSPERTELFA